MKSAIAFLTKEPQEETITFAFKLKNRMPQYVDIFVISDFDGYAGPDNLTQVKIVQIKTEACESAGYKNSVSETSINKSVTAIDNALYYFCEIKKEYGFVWLIEEDVFIPSIEAMLKLHENNCKHDLVVSKLEKKTNDVLDWNWKSVVGKIDKPFYRTMACVAGMSRKFLNEIKKYVHENKTLFNSEVMWPTIAAQNSMQIATPNELRTILWKADWGLDDALVLPENLFHPVKSLKRQASLRVLIEVAHIENYEPANKLQRFLANIDYERV